MEKRNNKKEISNNKKSMIMWRIVSIALSFVVSYVGYNMLLQENEVNTYCWIGLGIIGVGIIMMSIFISISNSTIRKIQKRMHNRSRAKWRIRKIFYYLISWMLIISGVILGIKHFFELNPSFTLIGILFTTTGLLLWVKFYYEEHSEWKDMGR